MLYLQTSSGCSVARSSRLLWEQEVAGSNPATPTLFKNYLFRDVAQPGSAHAWGAWGRRFKSCHPDFFLIIQIKMGIKIFYAKDQANGNFNNGEILEKKPIGFPQDGGKLKPYSNLFY